MPAGQGIHVELTGTRPLSPPRAPELRGRAWSAIGASFKAATPALLFGIRLWAAVCLALFVAFRLELQTPSWAGTSAAIVCQPVLGASLRKGWFRMIGTVIGAIAAVVLSACFIDSRAGFLLSLALWGAACAFVATLLRNFASYAAALAGFTAAIIAGDELGAVGGANGDAFNLALARGTEICVGIVCAGLVLATTDLGGTRRRLATLIAGLGHEIACGLLHALQLTGPDQAPSRSVRRALLVRVSGLDTVIDQAAGEIATLPFRPIALQAAAEGLTDALLAWRSIANHLESAPDAAGEAARVNACLEGAIPGLGTGRVPGRWSDPRAMRRDLASATRALVAMPAATPALRLLVDRTASGLLGLSRGAAGVLALADPCAVAIAPRVARLRVPDLLPSLVAAVRAFVAIGAVSLLWIWTAWPSGASSIVFATVAVTIFAPQGDAAYAAARSFTAGIALTAICAAIVAFAVLPRVATFAGFCASLGLVLVPAGALSAQPWQQPLFAAWASMFTPLLAPSNPMTYDPAAYYNSAIALLSGMALGMLSFRLIPPMSPRARARRLLALTLRDLRRLARGEKRWSGREWRARVYGRLAAMPPSADTLQAARLAAALSLGTEIARLRRTAVRFGLAAELARATGSLAEKDSATAIRAFKRFDAALVAVPAGRPGAKVRLRARGTVLAAIDLLAAFAPYFDAEGPR